MNADVIDVKDVTFSRLNDYMGLWAMAPSVFENAVQLFLRTDLRAHVAATMAAGSPAAASSGSGYNVVDGVAIINLQGTMMKHLSSMEEGASTVKVRHALRSAVRDSMVNSIVLRIDSPGGTVAGTKDLADDVRRANEKKRVVAYVEDMCASAAYFVASQADQIYVNDMAVVGSIGTFGVVYDYSARATMEGVKAYLFATGSLKGAGTPGTELTKEQQAEFQAMVDEMNKYFLAAVQEGRGLTSAAMKELATGGVWIGAEAKRMGLVDGVRTLDAVMDALRGKSVAKAKSDDVRAALAADAGSDPAISPVAKDKSDEEEGTMTEPEKKAASIDEIEAACDGAGSDFVLGQVKAKASVQEAQAAWIKAQNARVAAATKRAEEAEASAKKVAPGAPPLKTRAAAGAEAEEEGESASDRFQAAVDKHVARGMKKSAAIAAVVRANPALHSEYLEEVNAKRGTR